MSMRGTKAVREDEWRRGQHQDGYRDGRADKPAVYADQHYQRGYRAGVVRRALIQTLGFCGAQMRPVDGIGAASCNYLATHEYLDTEFSGEWLPICGVHARVAERNRFATHARMR